MNLQPLHIFRVGTHTAQSGQTLTFSAADLAATAAAYDPARHEAPLVVGHPELNEPAYGWVRALTVAGDALLAEPDQVQPEFAELVNAGRYKKISAAFFAPTAPNNPTPGAYYLRHVGFLGAAPPAVKGMRPPRFADADTASDLITIEFAQPEPVDMPDTPDDLAAREAALAQREAALAQREADLNRAAQVQRRAELAAFAEVLVTQGRLLPRDQAGLVAFLFAAPAETTLEFADGGQTIQMPARQWFEDWLKRLPVQVEYAERTRSSAADRPTVLTRRDFDALDPLAQRTFLRQAGNRVTE